MALSDETAQGPIDAAGPDRGIRGVVTFVLFATVGLAVAILTPIGDHLTVDSIRDLADELGYLGPTVLVGAGIVSPILFLPRWPIAFVGGLLYGIVGGTVLATFASTLGALLHYALAGSLLATAARRVLARFRLSRTALTPYRFFLAIFFLRAFPLSNFVATNLLAGALRAPLLPYATASFLGMIPSSIMYASWGKLLKKPSTSFYIVAVASAVFIALGTLLARRWLLPWFRGLRADGAGAGAADHPTTDEPGPPDETGPSDGATPKDGAGPA